MDQGLLTCTVFTDIRKAFGAINHSILPDKLEFCGISKLEQEKPRGFEPRCCSPSPRGVKYIMVTQDTSSSLCRDEYLFGRPKTGGLKQVTTKKKSTKRKTGVTTPRPDGGVKRARKEKRVSLEPVLTAG